MFPCYVFYAASHTIINEEKRRVPQYSRQVKERLRTFLDGVEKHFAYIFVDVLVKKLVFQRAATDQQKFVHVRRRRRVDRPVRFARVESHLRNSSTIIFALVYSKL